MNEILDSEPTVSILIPNYNHAHHLRQSLTGALSQTRPADEVLIIDDGSTDNSIEVIQEFSKKYSNLKLVENDVNRGMQYTINRLLELAKGDYIVCAAADDELYPNFIESHLKVLKEYPEVGMSVSEYVIMTQSGRHINQSRAMPEAFGFDGLPEHLSPTELQALFSDRYLWMTSNAIMARLDYVMEVGGFLKDQEWHSDWFTYYAVGLRYGVCLIPEGLGAIRENPSGYSGTGMRDRQRQEQVLRAIVRDSSNPPNQDLRKLFRRYPGILSVFGKQLIIVLAKMPRYWDIAFPYTWYMIKRFKRNTGRSWWNLTKYIIKRALV